MMTPGQPSLESTARIIECKNPTTGKKEFRVAVINVDAKGATKQFVSNEAWPTRAAALDKLKEHFRLLGVPEHQIRVDNVS